jgi:hypothetical protein
MNLEKLYQEQENIAEAKRRLFNRKVKLNDKLEDLFKPNMIFKGSEGFYMIDSHNYSDYVVVKLEEDHETTK